MKWLAFLTGFGGVGFLIWYFTPPSDVLGSYLPQSSDRKREMIRAEAEQDFTLFGNTTIH